MDIDINRYPKSQPSASRCSLTSSPAGRADRRRDGSHRRQPRSTGRPPLGKPCARQAVARHQRQPLYPTGRQLVHYLGNRRRKLCPENASPAPTRNNLWEPRLPHSMTTVMQAFIQLVPPISPPLFPVEILEIGEAPAVV